MADNKQVQQVREASWDMVDSLRETNRAVADGLVAIQDRNLRFAENSFLNWMDLLTHQTESVRYLQQQWGQQIPKQQEAFQRLAAVSVQISLGFLLAPFAFARQLIDVREDRLPRERVTPRVERELLW
jgi:hypothetical protein